jgi:bifunctional polynucleotide phosphatase/kinase
MEDEELQPAKKKAKRSCSEPTTTTQTNLFSFFSAGPKAKGASKGKTEEKEKYQDDGKSKSGKSTLKSAGTKVTKVTKVTNESLESLKATPITTATSTSTSTSTSTFSPPTTKNEEAESSTKETVDSTVQGQVPDPIVPKAVKTPYTVMWQSVKDNLVIVRKPSNESPRTKVAAFDLDGTLVAWSSSFAGFWPSQLNHYELWNSRVPTILRQLHDDGYKLLLFSNQGGIQKAHAGKKATLIKNVIDWLAYIIDRPVFAVMSTKSPKKSDDSYHKPSPKMWKVAITSLNKRQDFDLSQSFFVGDSADPNDPQGGVDLRFAQAVGEVHGGNDETTTATTTTTRTARTAALKFYAPPEYFGPSDGERRQKQSAFQGELPPPKEALTTRSALLGGYFQHGPILLILCGVQGSGKSTFCEILLAESNQHQQRHWRHFSQ